MAVETPKIKKSHVNSELSYLLDKVLCVEDLEEINMLVEKNPVEDNTARLASRKGVTDVVEKYLKDGNNANRIMPSVESGINVKTCLMNNAISGSYKDIVKFV